MIIFNALQSTMNGGIGRYSYELAKHMYLAGRIEIKFVIREQDKQLFDFVQADNLIIANNINNSKDRNYYEQFLMSKLIRSKYQNAIIHYPDTMAPLFVGNKVVITAHDLAFKRMRNAFTIKSRVWKNFITDLSIKKADQIVCITEFTKSEILKYYTGIDEKKLSVIHNGFNDLSVSPIIFEKVREQLKRVTKQKYILNVSTISPRKNINGLIESFYKVSNETNYNLIIAGRYGWMYESTIDLVNKLGLENRVYFTGEVSEDELKYLYKNASIFMYPSFYEGFGLPPLEAMAYGVPCIVSNQSSIPEVVGDATMLVNPNSTEDMSNSIIALTQNEKLQKELREKGYERVKSYSWQKCAEGVIEVYNRL